jgi:hypothetical protein
MFVVCILFFNRRVHFLMNSTTVKNKSCLKRTIPNQIIVVGNYSYYIVGTVYLRRPNFSIKAL